MNLGGRTIVVGNIKGTDDLAPENNMAVNINTPAANDLWDGNTIKLSSYATPGGNIGAIGTRYFREDVWTLRLAAIERDNNVKLEFKEYNWNKEELPRKLRDLKDGKIVDHMPDLLVVPDDWLWSLDGLLANNAVYSMREILKSDGSQIFELDADKWNKAYESMTTKDGKTYSTIAEPSMDAIGLFVRKTLLSKVGVTSGNSAKTGIYTFRGKINGPLQSWKRSLTQPSAIRSWTMASSFLRITST